MQQEYHGVGGAPGILIGRVFVHLPSFTTTPTAHAEPPDADPAVTLARFGQAQSTAARNLEQLAERLHAGGHSDEAGIFEAQAMLAEDPTLTELVQAQLEAGQPLAAAIQTAATQMHAMLAVLDDPYLSERAADMLAVGKAIHAVLYPSGSPLHDLPPDTVIVAPDLTPAETTELYERKLAVAFVTAHGGNTGHTAILARSLGLPAVVGVGEAVLQLANDTPVIVDGHTHTVIVDPAPATLATYQQQRTDQAAAQDYYATLRDLPGQFADGHRVGLWANIGRSADAAQARAHGAEGIGLFRTEFLFLERTTAPSEDEQYAAYRETLQIMAGRTVIIRTLDIGGDKPLPYLHVGPEANPFLGVRGLRLCMQHADLFQAQLRAILRAAQHGDVWIMLPMVALPSDIAWAREQLQQATATLQAQGVAHRADVPLGIMIETPAAAVTVDVLARASDFFSIGTNDLSQYTLAVDRGQAELSARYPHDTLPVLRLIQQAVQAARQAGKHIGVCGELGGVPELGPLLAGMGVHELSMSPALIPPMKARLRELTYAEAHAAALHALAG